MKSALSALSLGACLVVLGSLSVSAQSATPPAPVSASTSVDAKAAAIRAQLPFLERAPEYNEIPMEYRLAAISGPKAERVVEDLIQYGFSDYGSLLLTKKEQLPANLREPGGTCNTCIAEKAYGTKRQLDYYVMWLRNLSAKQRKQLIATLEK